MKTSDLERMEELLKLIAGYEEAIRMAIENREWEFRKVLEKNKLNAYEKARRLAYGLPEKTSIPAKV